MGDDMPTQIARRAGDDGDLAGQTARNIALQSRRSGDDLGFGLTLSHGGLSSQNYREAALRLSFRSNPGEESFERFKNRNARASLPVPRKLQMAHLPPLPWQPTLRAAHRGF